MALEQYPVAPSEGICWTVEGYKGEQDFSNIYLGDRNIEISPEVTLTAVFTNNTQITTFLTWWKNETDSGVKSFVISDVRFFGKQSSYVIEQISEFRHLEKKGTLTFSARVLYDSDTITNAAPTVQNTITSVEKNTQNNYILLTAQDAEDDELTFEVVTYPTNGTLSGVVPALSYTPNSNFEGTDSFTFKTKDAFNESSVATMTISIGLGKVTNAQFDYNVSDDIFVSGNYHYDGGDGNIHRGTDDVLGVSKIVQPLSFVSRATTATYVDSGVLKYAIVDEARYEDGIALYEQESENLLRQSGNQAHSDWNPNISSFFTTATSLDILAPDGGTANVTKHTSNANGNSLFARAGFLSINAGDKLTASIYVYVPSGQGITNYHLAVDVGGITSQDTYTSTVFDAWVRMETPQYTTVEGGTRLDFAIYTAEGIALGDVFYSSFGQLERDSLLTSYIPTTTAAVTRDMDILTTDTFHSRATTATYISGGILYYTNIDQARIQDGILLLEEASTNKILHSDINDDVVWATSVGAARALNSIEAPDGTLTATTLTKTTATGVFLHQSNLSVINGDTVTVSLFVKKKTNDQVTISLRGENWAELGTIMYNFSTDTLDSFSGTGYSGYSSETFDNRWVRISLSINITKDDNLRLIIFPDNSTDINVDEVYIWGAQLEVGTAPTSYIPTTTTAVTRSADIASYPIKIWSNDHKITDNVYALTAKVIKWGERLSFEDFLNGYPNITSFTIDDNAGICQGMIFTRMFKDFPSFIRAFDTSQGIYFAYMFENCLAKGIPYFDLKAGLYFQGFLKGSDIENTQYLETEQGQYFQEFAMNSALTCMGGLNTINAINTLKMFDNTPNLTNPDGTAQVEIITSANQPWISASACIMTVDGITEVTHGTADITIVDGSTTATATYQVTYSDAVPVVSFAWAVTGATILSGQGTDTVVLEDIISSDVNFTISCAVTDAVGTIDTGDFNFNYTANYTYLILNLPVQGSLLNLKTYIDANNPSAKNEILINNSIINAPIETGTFDVDWNVKLVNTGHIQGIAETTEVDATNVYNNGLTLTSDMKLDNSNGIISGCGGHGGIGGEGADTSFPDTVEIIEIENLSKLTTQQSWVVPDHVTAMDVAIIGGGGGGAQRTDNAFNDRCGGGDKGGVGTLTALTVTGGQTVYFTLGVGGVSRFCSLGCDGMAGTGSSFGRTVAEADLSVGGGRGGSVHGTSGTVHHQGNGGLRTNAGLSVRDGYMSEVAGYGWYLWGGMAGFQDGPNGASYGRKGSGGAGGNRNNASSWNGYCQGGHGTIRFTYPKYLTGGGGGEGGVGAGYNTFDVGQAGTDGYDSTPDPTGNSGGNGGAGGNWGIAGANGADGVGHPDTGSTAGAVGKTAGKSIAGISFLKAGSLNGTLNGGTA